MRPALRNIWMAVCITVVSTPSVAAESAPFGLVWGMSAKEARGLGIVLKEQELDENGKTFTATKLPKVISDIALVH